MGTQLCDECSGERAKAIADFARSIKDAPDPDEGEDASGFALAANNAADATTDDDYRARWRRDARRAAPQN